MRNYLIGKIPQKKQSTSINRRISNLVTLIVSIFLTTLLSACVTFVSIDLLLENTTIFEDKAMRFDDSARAPNPALIDEVLRGERSVASAAWWGFDAADSTDALRQAILSGAETVLIPNMGSPWNVETIALESNQTILLEQGATLQAKRGAFKTDTSANVLFAKCKDNITIKGYGATLRMWKDDYASRDYLPSEHRHTIRLLGTKNILIEGLRVEKSGGDGLYLGSNGLNPTASCPRTHNENITVRNAIFANHLRQAISVIDAENFLIDGSWLLNTKGYFPLPQAGIDYEPNRATERIVNCTIRDSYIMGNNGGGVFLYLQHLNKNSRPVSVSVINTEIVQNNGDAVRIFRSDLQVKGVLMLSGSTIVGPRSFLSTPVFRVIEQ